MLLKRCFKLRRMLRMLLEWPDARLLMFTVIPFSIVAVGCTKSAQPIGQHVPPRGAEDSSEEARKGKAAEQGNEINQASTPQTKTSKKTDNEMLNERAETPLPSTEADIPAVPPVSSGGETQPDLPDSVTPLEEPSAADIPGSQVPMIGESHHGRLLVPVTPFSNMASGYQATNPGFRAFLKDNSGRIIAAGPLNMDAVIDGYSDDASSGSAYGRLVLDIKLKYVDGAIETGEAEGQHQGKLSICMSDDTAAAFDASACRNLGGNLHPERPFQWIDKPVSYQVKGDQISVVSFSGPTGEGGTRSQIALAVYHPAYGFAAPGKAFKDYQSPLVLDLSGNKAMDLIDVWDEKKLVRFDLNGDGKVVRTGWVAPEDGLLALDFNRDGLINSGRELFGEYTVRAPLENLTNTGKTFENGFQALAMLDSNKDGRIDQKDARFSELIVWRDRNGDGISQAGEAQPLSAFDIVGIDLAYVRSGGLDKPLTVLGNEVRLEASYQTKDGRKHLIADVWFKQRRGPDVAGN